MSDDEKQRAITLLEGQHPFPGSFMFRVVVRPPDLAPVSVALSHYLGQENVCLESTRDSRSGTYVAAHFLTQVLSAEQVLQVYEVLKGVPGVLTVL